MDKRPDSRTVLWLLPVLFAVHDAEELLAIPGWVAAHRDELAGLEGNSPFAARLIGSLPTTISEAAVAIGVIFAVFLAVTARAAASRRPGAWLFAYAALLGGLFLHVFTHAGQAVLFGGYVPGLLGAVLVVLPGSVYLYRRLFASGLLNLGRAASAAAVGIALFVPGALLAHVLGRWLSHIVK